MTEHSEGIPPQRLDYAPVAVGAFRAAGRGLLARALRAARAHDGSAQALDRLVDDIDPLDAWAMGQGASSSSSSSLSRDVIEQGLFGHLRNKNGTHRPLTISEILDMAVRQFGKRLAGNRIAFDVVETGFCFIPPDKEERIMAGNGSGVAPPSFVARFDAMVRLLNAQEIATDDLIIYRGELQKGIMRQKPYHLIQIPRLDREIMVCDQVGEASFVGRGLQGPIFWATYGKKMLEQQEGVTRIVHAGTWEDRLLAALFTDNAPQPRNNVRREQARGRGFPLTVNLILVKALEYAAAHGWKLPTRYGDEIEGLPGQTWGTWNVAINHGCRGLRQGEYKGLADLFRDHGLKQSLCENKVAIEAAWRRVAAGEPHGLSNDRGGESSLSIDKILVHALKHAAAHQWRLPTDNSGPIEGLPGQTWCAWNVAINYGCRGLRQGEYKGLADLFRDHGLKQSLCENKVAIEAAWRRVAAGEPHGLSNDRGGESSLSIDKILVHALEYAAAHGWRLPTRYRGEIKGLPGQNWMAWDMALREGSRGLRKGEYKGLADLFRDHGLKQGRCENKVAIEEAYRRVAAGEPHGLSNDKGDESSLGIDKILVHALKHAAAHQWQLPTENSGPIEGLPGQNWKAWHAALQKGNRGLRKGEYNGLADLFRQHGLKQGRINNGGSIRQAWECYTTTGEHGLVPLDRGAATPARPECAAVVAPVASCG